VKFKTIKAREGKGLARSIMQLLDDAPDDDEDSFEAESEEDDDDDDDDDDDQWGDAQGHSVNKNSDAELSSDDGGSQLDDDGSPEGGFTLSNGYQTIRRLQDDLLADEDEPDDGTLYFYRISICLCLAIRFIHT
jgi:U3 small nucleolar RNA-associated protein MPP10